MVCIAVTGGKGGTGKSTIACALANELSRKYRMLLVDADADCPNDHILLAMKRRKLKEVSVFLPKINEEKCIACGACVRACREHALVQLPGKKPILIEEQCIGCKACQLVCPANAIEESSKIAGRIYFSKKGKLALLSSELKEGFEESSVVIREVKKLAGEMGKKFDITIVDTAAGAHCNVITALLNCNYALAVTEPTPLAAHDLALILELLAILGINAGIVLNKFGIASSKQIEKIAKRFNSRIIARVPYSKNIEKSYMKSLPIKDESTEKLAKLVEAML